MCAVAAWLEVYSFEDVLDSLLLMLSRMFVLVSGGLLLSLWMWKGLLAGFTYFFALCIPQS